MNSGMVSLSHGMPGGPINMPPHNMIGPGPMSQPGMPNSMSPCMPNNMPPQGIPCNMSPGIPNNMPPMQGNMPPHSQNMAGMGPGPMPPRMSPGMSGPGMSPGMSPGMPPGVSPGMPPQQVMGPGPGGPPNGPPMSHGMPGPMMNSDPFYSSPFSMYSNRRHAPFMGQPDYRLYELNKRLQQRSEVSILLPPSIL